MTPKTKKIGELETENASLKAENAQLKEALAYAGDRHRMDTLAAAAGQVDSKDKDKKIDEKEKELKRVGDFLHEPLEEFIDTNPKRA